MNKKCYFCGEEKKVYPVRNGSIGSCLEICVGTVPIDGTYGWDIINNAQICDDCLIKLRKNGKITSKIYSYLVLVDRKWNLKNL